LLTRLLCGGMVRGILSLNIGKKIGKGKGQTKHYPMTRLRIISDGTSAGTRVIDSMGRQIENVTAIAWKAEAGKLATAEIAVIDIPVDLVVDEAPKTNVVTCPICDHQIELNVKDIGRRADVEGKEVRWKCGKCGRYSMAEDWFDVSGMN